MEYLWRAAEFSGITLIAFCIMTNHFHVVAYVPDREDLPDEEVLRRIRILYSGSQLAEKLKEWNAAKVTGQSSTGFYTCVTHKRFTEVTCVGKPSKLEIYREGGAHNRYRNPFGGEFAYFKAEDGSSSRMLVSYDVPCVNGERGRVWGQSGGYDDAQMKFLGDEAKLKELDYRRHQLPIGVAGGGHGGSHGYLTDDFLQAILDPKHRPCVDVKTALDTTVAGIYAHMSALKGGETLRIPAVG